MTVNRVALASGEVMLGEEEVKLAEESENSEFEQPLESRVLKESLEVGGAV